MAHDLLYQIALELIPGVGSKAAKALLSYCGSAEAVFKQPRQKLLKIPGVGEKMTRLLTRAPLAEAEDILKKSEKAGAQILHYTHDDFPQRLRHVPDSPNILYKKGHGTLNGDRCIAIVGTRKATDYGKSVTEKIIHDLRDLNVTVVSGLAYGIDIHAHKCSLKSGLPTLAVLAGGVDRIYPSTHKKYVEEIMADGALISESSPGTTPDAFLFPARNRIIAGMTDATIVVEAAAKGGALITAHIADSYNRVVFAVPGDVGNSYSEGTNKLIASQRALIYTGVEDLLYHLQWDAPTEDKKPRAIPDLPEDEKIIFELLAEKPPSMEIDLISLSTSIPINQVASHLLSLEFKGLVKSIPGKRFGLTSKS